MCSCLVVCFFFFKQKTAYEMRISDWSSDVCSSDLWIIPRMVQGMGLQTVIRRQGKQHLSPMEQKYVKPVELITGFRPCQWLVGYEWSSNPANDALWLTASICYDATDLKLASDLRDR